MVIGLTRLGLELTIYRTRCADANHYTTNVVPFNLVLVSTTKEKEGRVMRQSMFYKGFCELETVVAFIRSIRPEKIIVKWKYLQEEY